MTKKQALAKAQEIYGAQAFVECVKGSDILPPYRVGFFNRVCIHIKGSGQSWEEALEQAAATHNKITVRKEPQGARP